MKKITYLLSLFLLFVGTAMAQLPTAPAADQAMTAEELRALTSETHVAIKQLQTSKYPGDCWFACTSGKGDVEKYDAGCIFIWEPGDVAGSGYLKVAYPGASDGDGYIQTSGLTSLGAKATAQVYYPVTVSTAGSGNTAFGPGSELASGTDAAKFIRLLSGTDNTAASWFNFNGLTNTSTATGVWTAMEIRRATLPEYTPVTKESNLNNSKAYVIVNARTSLMTNAKGTALSTRYSQDGAAFDASDTKQQFAILTNSIGEHYLYSISANKFFGNDGSLTEQPTVPVVLNNGIGHGRFFLRFKDGNYINTSNAGGIVVDGWSWADSGNSNVLYEVADVSLTDALAKIASVTVTVNYQVLVGETYKNYKTVTMSVLKGSTITNENLATNLQNEYVTVSSCSKEDAVTADCEVTAYCTQNLPFTASSSFADATWYLIDMHSNDSGDINSGAKNYVWTATTDADAYTTAEVTLPKYDTKQSAAFGDNMLWCFVGDVADGFVIYNKAAGSEYALAKPETGNTAAKLAAVGDATPFRIYKSSHITGATCFKKQGDDHYVNTQSNEGTGHVKALRGWTVTDGGSSCRFFAPDHYLLNYAADIVAGPANSLGTAKYFNTEGNFDNFNSTIAAANADHFNATATANLATVLTEYAADEANATLNSTTINNGGYYRLMNYKYKNYMTSGLDGSTNTLWGGLSASEAPATAGTIVKVVADESNYKLYVQGLEVGQMKDASARLNLTGGGLFTITNTGNKYSFMDVSLCDPAPTYPNYRAIHQAAGNTIVGWETGAEATKWYVIPATTLDLPLNVVDDKTYATTYLPFDVTLPADGSVKAYIVANAEGDSESGRAFVSEVGDIPANQGVVLVGQSASATKATLTLGTASADCTGNRLSGTNPRRPIAESAKTNYYIFGSGANGVGFYHPNSTTLKENRAYLPASAVTASAVNGFLLDFGGANTGIEAALQTDEANATYYDLSGRRVNRPAKGIYVKNGKKIYVK